MSDRPRRTLLTRLKVAIAKVGAVIVLLITDMSLRLVGYRQTCRWMLALSPTPPSAPYPGSAARAYAIASTIGGAVNLTNVNCLRRALSVWWVLRWLGISTRVRIGINLTGGHAWVEHQNLVLTDNQDIASQFAILYDDQLLPEMIAKRLKFE